MPKSKVKGAALVVAMILLIALSLLAISSMNTATLDLIMAGNEQYRARAFATAEAGLATALSNGNFNSSNSVTPAGQGDNYFTYSITKPNVGTLESAPIGSSSGSFGAAYYQITSTGFSKRSATSQVIQELYQIVRNTPDQNPTTNSNCANDSLYTSCQ